MSVWFVNDQWPDFFPLDDGPVTYVDCRDAGLTLDLDTRDALSDPAVETLLPAALALWPRGAAWGAPGMEAPGDDTVIARLTRALLAALADLYRRAWQITLESRASTLVDSLDDWEADWGLPDACARDIEDEARRRINLRAKVARLSTITPPDFVRLAARLGYVVALEEPAPLRCGEDELGLGGEPSGAALPRQIAIHVDDLPSTQFEAGLGAAGTDRLLDFDVGTLDCAIRRQLPAWIDPCFSIAPLPVGFVLVAETGAMITVDAGSPLLAPYTP